MDKKKEIKNRRAHQKSQQKNRTSMNQREMRIIFPASHSRLFRAIHAFTEKQEICFHISGFQA